MVLTAEQALLLIVDVQERLAPAIHQGAAVTARIATLVRGARATGVPVLACEHYPRGLGPMVPDLAALLAAEERVEKIHFSLAAEPGMAERLRGLGRRQVLVAGMEAHVCVLQTALGLRGLGFEVYLAADATGSRSAADAALAIERLRGEGVRIVSTEMALFEWLRRGGTPALREVLALIR